VGVAGAGGAEDVGARGSGSIGDGERDSRRRAGAAIGASVAGGAAVCRGSGVAGTGSGRGALPSRIVAPRPYGEPPRAVSRATRCSADGGGSAVAPPGVTSGWLSALPGSPNTHSKPAGLRPRLSAVTVGRAGGGGGASVGGAGVRPGVGAAGGGAALRATRCIAGRSTVTRRGARGVARGGVGRGSVARVGTGGRVSVARATRGRRDGWRRRGATGPDCAASRGAAGAGRALGVR
jgi:hypothetical protein